MASTKLTRTFSLTATTDHLLRILSRMDERPRSAEMRYLIIQRTEEVLETRTLRPDVRELLEKLLNDAKSEVYEPDPESDD